MAAAHILDGAWGMLSPASAAALRSKMAELMEAFHGRTRGDEIRPPPGEPGQRQLPAGGAAPVGAGRLSGDAAVRPAGRRRRAARSRGA